MGAAPCTRMPLRAAVAAAALSLFALPASAQILPWEITVAEIEAGRLRGLAERLDKQNVLYQLHIGDVQKMDLVETAAHIDRILETLQRGVASYSVPPPWTPELRTQIGRVEDVWGPVRAIAIASPVDHYRVTRQFMPAASRRGDPLLVRSFDLLIGEFLVETEKLLDVYHAECVKTGLELCPTARTSGYAAMLIERAMKEAIFVASGIEAERSRARLKKTIDAYQQLRKANNENPFFAAALDPERGASAKAAGELFVSLRQDWDAMQAEFSILAAGDEGNYDLARLLGIQARLVQKVERLTAALIRYASVTYGA